MKDELFEEWCNEHGIQVESFEINSILDFSGKQYLLLDSEKEELFLPEDFSINYSRREISILENNEVDFVIFRFGSYFYYSHPDTIKLEIFLYQSSPKYDFQLDIPYLGIHGEYELGNGSRLYKDWCKKAKWLGLKSLGICELNTLGGLVSFQEACKKEGIKSILGETLTFDLEEGITIKLILFVKNEQGLETLIKLNNSSTRSYEELKLIDDNLVVILSNESNPNILPRLSLSIHTKISYQLDLVSWDSDSKDRQILEYFENWYRNFRNTYKPILIQTSYFLEKSQSRIQKRLNNIVSYGFNSTSQLHYFRNFDTVLQTIESVFEDKNKAEILFYNSVENTDISFEDIDFSIRLKNLYLPKYELDEEQKKSFRDEDELILHLIEQGMIEKGWSDKVEYWERIEMEFEIIKRGGFVSYFLILCDLIKYCKENDIWWGVGRGSSGGSLVASSLDIIQIDPLQYDLLFERFLNPARISKGLPDIDFDLQGSRRDEVKSFMAEKYGSNRIASIGTYQTLKIRAAIKDLSRQFGLESQYMNYISSLIDSSWSYSEFIQNSLSIPQLRDFVIKNQEVIELIPLCIGQCKNTSIHAAGVVITPKQKGLLENTGIDSWIPTRLTDSGVVTEWEGSILDDIGFLKNDILGIAQLDKFKSIHSYILKNRGKDIRFKDIPLDDKLVFGYFQQGLNEDVFQLGASGLKSYSIELRPEKIEDLIAIVALYRPGPIFVGTHKKYVKLKNGEEEVHYHWGCEEITKETYGLIVYQEQAIRICQVVGGFDLPTADDVRKAMGKMIRELLETFEKMFVEGAVSKGCPQDEAQYIWDEMAKFAEYSFNKSHAACYAITGYYSQWYKVHYPLEFWITSLEMSTSDELHKRISEINKFSEVKLVAPDINKSSIKFEGDVQTNSIFWSLNSIKFVSDKVLESIFNERDKNGEFFSLSEFEDRVERRVVNKRVITNLILSGGFDSFDTTSISIGSKRFKLLVEFYERNKYPKEEILEYYSYKDYEWILKQKQLSAYGFLNYQSIFHTTKLSLNYQYLSIDDLNQEERVDTRVITIGVVKELVERKSRKGPFLQVELDINSETFYCTLWNETYSEYQKLLDVSLNKIICISGTLVYDSWKKQNVLHSTTSSKVELL